MIEYFTGTEPVKLQDFALSGNVCVDGSCDQHVIKELRRAAWGAAAIDSDGTVIARMRGTVPADWIQSSQSGEYAALAITVRLLTGIGRIFSDCSM